MESSDTSRPGLPRYTQADSVLAAVERLGLGDTVPLADAIPRLAREKNAGWRQLATDLDRQLNRDTLRAMADAIDGLRDRRDFYSLAALDGLVHWQECTAPERLRMLAESGPFLQWMDAWFGLDQIADEARAAIRAAGATVIAEQLRFVFLRRFDRRLPADVEEQVARAEAQLQVGSADPHIDDAGALLRLAQLADSAVASRSSVAELALALGRDDSDELIEEILEGGRIPLLLLGPSGAGKTRFARKLCEVQGGPFVRVDCGQRQRFEGDLVGMKKGAFTGTESHVGALERANGGMLFLDEIQELDEEQRAVLLGPLGDRTVFFTPLGSSKELSSRFRIVSASMEEEAKLRARLGDALWFRLEGMTLKFPKWEQRTKASQTTVVEELARTLGGEQGLSDDQISTLTRTCRRAIVGKRTLPGEIRALTNKISILAVRLRLGRPHTLEDVRRFLLDDSGRRAKSNAAPRAEDLRGFVDVYRAAQESSGRKKPRAQDVAPRLFPNDAEGTAGNKLTALIRELFGDHIRWSTVHAEVASLGDRS
jgi:transcriptional regulator with AAA-type ATPase domain